MLKKFVLGLMFVFGISDLVNATPLLEDDPNIIDNYMDSVPCSQTTSSSVCSASDFSACWGACNAAIDNPYCYVISAGCSVAPGGNLDCACIWGCGRAAGGTRNYPSREMAPCPSAGCPGTPTEGY